MENSGMPVFSGTDLLPKKSVSIHNAYISKPIKILLNNGADIDIKRNDGLNVLTFGIKYEIINKVNIIKLFIQHYQKKFKFLQYINQQ